MPSLKQFITDLNADATNYSAGDVVRARIFGLDVAAVLPPDTLEENRDSRMNQFWDLLGEREALVIAVTARSER